MAFTMHSHSGQFCPGHASDNLEDIIRHAISLGFKTIGLTEHMPRYAQRDLYPEELDDPNALEALPPRHEAYLVESVRLRSLLPQIHILIGLEAEFIRPEYASYVAKLIKDPRIDYFIGSVHHVHSIPIDYDATMYAAAVAASNDSEQQLWEEYYDLQYEMLTALKPHVIGHFDLIRLLASDPARDIREWKGAWSKAQRNLKLAAEQGGWLECNTAALRKGLAEPYPGRIIAQEWLRLGGKFTLSDDSHGIGHVATNYARGVAYLQSLGVRDVWTLRRNDDGKLEDVAVSLEEIRKQFD